MRNLLCLAFISLAACGSKSQSVDQSQLSVTANCQEIGQGTHSFLAWGDLNATSYSCSIPQFSKLNCTYHAATTGEAEMRCQNPNGIVQGKGSCKALPDTGNMHSYFSTDNRTFQTTNLLNSSPHDCGVLLGLRCVYLVHDPDGSDSQTFEDVHCTDHELP